jgi:methyl-accepting chemotaxis protein
MPPDSNLTVVDRSATVLTRYPDPIKWIGQSVAEAPITKRVFSQGEGRAEEVGLDGVQRLYAFTTVYGMPGEPLIKMWASIPKEIVYAEVNRAFTRNVTLLFLVTALIIAISWVVSDRSILRPLNALMEAAEKLGSGDFSVRAALGSLKGELGQLGARFNDMAESLQ